jgi:hypothetical protein
MAIPARKVLPLPVDIPDGGQATALQKGVLIAASYNDGSEPLMGSTQNSRISPIFQNIEILPTNSEKVRL